MPHDHDVDERIARVRLALRDACQDHVLSYVDAGLATPEETASLLTQIEALDLPELNRIFNGLGIEPSASVAAAAGNDEYAPLSDLASVDTTSPALLREWEEMGLDAIGRGKVAALVLSGGQGTRLGFDGPKGMYDIGLPSGKSIFQLLAERILRVSALAAERFLRSPEGKDCPNEGSTRKHIPFYVMTSPLNHEKTQDFFKENNYFGLCPADVFFFRQSTMPCFDLKGKLLLESPTSLAQAPDGNGGIYPSLARTGALADMRARGIDAFHVFSVDNVLIKVADPTFLGFCLARKSDCGNMVVWKKAAEEKVGVMVRKNGRPAVVEYSEMDTSMTTLREAGKAGEEGKLVYGAGNICSHFLTLDFVEHVVLPRFGAVYHAARKMIPALPTSFASTFPVTVTEKVAGVKLEAFIFDVLPFSERVALWEVRREDAFAPVKDAPGSGSDTPERAREMLSAEAVRWVGRAGGKVVGQGEGGGEGGRGGEGSEISPLVSYRGEGLGERVGGMEVALPIRFLDA